MTDFDPFSPDPSKSALPTPTLDEVIRRQIDTRLLELHTWTPGRVTRVYSNGLVDVQPLIKRTVRVTGKSIALPILPSIPVEHPRGAGYWVKLPVAVGDYGRVVFAERSLDVFRVQGAASDAVDPNDVRRHSLSDGVFVPGLYPDNQPLTGDPTELQVHNGQAQVSLKKAGKFRVENLSGDELLDLLTQLAEQCSLIQNMGGPTTNAASFAALKSRIQALKG